VTFLQTGGGTPLVSDQVTLSGNGNTGSVIEYQFGFNTDEVPAPNTFLDSFTVSIEDSASDVAVVSTTDASGTVWEPSSPGAVTLSAWNVGYQSMAPTQLAPVNGQGVAYDVNVTLPPSLKGTTFTVDFDLFDDMNPSTFATAYFSNVAIVATPEPTPATLACLGALMIGLIKKCKQ